MAYTSIDKHTDYFRVKTYTGNGSDDRDIVFDETAVSLQPDMLISVRRDSADNFSLYDSVRGMGKELRTADTGAEYARTNNIQAFNSNGFQVGDDGQVNANSGTYVSWAWKAGGAASANTEGNTDTSISANTTSGFSIIDGCDNLNDDDTFGHGLDSAPNMVWLKRLDDTSGWRVFYTGIASGQTLSLQDNSAVGSDNDCIKSVSSTLITIKGAGTGGTQGTGENVAYAWHSVAGFSKIGTYTGNGNANGPFIYTGFKPSFILCKRAVGGTDSWFINDNQRSATNGTNPNSYYLRPNEGSTEGTSASLSMDLYSNGFKCRNSDNAYNASGNTYLYMAFGQSLVGSNNITAKAH